MSSVKRTMVCGDCWQDLRPSEYEPYTFIEGVCSRCGAFAFVHRVKRAEVRLNPLKGRA